MSEIFLLSDAETVEYDGVEYDLDRCYFKSGLLNNPVRVWTNDGTEIHYHPQTTQVVVIELETGDTEFVHPVESDGEPVQLEEGRK